MKQGAIRFIQHWLVNTLGVLVAVAVLPGVDCRSGGQLVLASLLLGVLNACVRPFLLFAALPLLVMTLGLFLVFINAALLYFVSWAVPALTIDSFGWSLLASLIIGLVSLLTNGLLGSRRMQIRLHRHRPPRRDDNDHRPFIDV